MKNARNATEHAWCCESTVNAFYKTSTIAHVPFFSFSFWIWVLWFPIWGLDCFGSVVRASCGVWDGTHSPKFLMTAPGRTIFGPIFVWARIQVQS